MVFEALLNPVFSPLLKLPVGLAIVIIAFVISLLITYVYKWMTDQELMKQMKDQIKEFQKEIKSLKGEPQKALAVQKKAMEVNMKYMMKSMKPTFITLLPIIIIFGWLNAHLAFEPIMPGQEFFTEVEFDDGTTGEIKLVVSEGIELLSNATQKISDSKASWNLKGEGGNYLLEYQYEGKGYTKELLITDDRAYEKPIKVIKETRLNVIKLSNQKVKPISFLPFGWLGTYILFSIIFSMSLRKILKLH